MSWIRSGRLNEENDALTSGLGGKEEPFIMYNGAFIEDGNPWYNKEPKGVSDCIPGTNSAGDKDGKGRPGANVLDNCVGFAAGAFNETYFENKKIMYGNDDEGSEYFSSHPNGVRFFNLSIPANKFIERAKDTNTLYNEDAIVDLPAGLKDSIDKEMAEFSEKYILGPEDYPPLGGLVVWGGAACHAAYISEVVDKDTIWVLQSGWKVPAWGERFYNGYIVKRYKATRNRGNRTNIWWYQNGRLTDEKHCLGFLVNPAVLESAVRGPMITEITQDSPKSITVKGNVLANENLVDSVELYYKWDTNEKEEISIENWKGDSPVTATILEAIVSEEGVTPRTFLAKITKPRGAKSVSVVPQNIKKSDNDNPGDNKYYPGDMMYKKLKESYPCVTIKDSKGKNRTAIPHIYTGDKWGIAVPTMRDSDGWYELYNTDKEKVQ